MTPASVQYWVYPSHNDGKPAGDPTGPYTSTADAIDHLLPGGIALVTVAVAGAWLGRQAEWPVRS